MKKLIIILIVLLLPAMSFAADTKGSALSAPAGGTIRTDKVYVIDDPAGTPVSAADTIANLFSLIQCSDLSNAGTGVATALAVNVGSAGAPVLFDGAGGTPSAITLTNGTGLPVASGVSGLGTGVATALAVNVGSAGAPVVLNGALGTPSSGTLTNATGLPVATGISGLGTGVATALAVNVGSAGAPVLFNGAGGTPSSLTLTNATGLPLNGVTAAGGAATINGGAYQHLFGTNVDTSAYRFGLAGSYFEVVNSGGTDVIVRLVGSNITANLGTFTVSTDSVHAQTGTTADDDLYLAARDVDGAAYVNMITLKAGNEPYAYLGPQANGWRVDQTGAMTAVGTASIATTEVDRIPITAFTDGASPPAAAAVVSSADGRFNCRAFDGASNEDVFFTWKAPADIDATQGIKFSVSGVVGAATAPANTEVVAFSLAGVSIGNSDAAGSVGTAQTSSLTADATYAQYDSLDTAFSSAITVTNLAAGETVSLKLIRLATTTDTYAQDFHPHTILIKYVRLHNASF